MPLSINVGLSRKASRDYQSSGVSINIVAELDQTLLAKPEELQQQVGNLYAQAEQALDRQAQEPRPAERPPFRPNGQPTGRSNGQPRNGGNGHDRNGSGGNGHRNGNGRNGGGMTASQRKAILSIAERHNIDIDYECREIIGADFEALSVRQASDMIDHLKSIQPTNGNGR